MSDYPNYDFTADLNEIFDKIREDCKNYEDIEKKLKFLRYVLHECEIYRTKIENKDFSINTFMTSTEIEIAWSRFDSIVEGLKNLESLLSEEIYYWGEEKINRDESKREKLSAHVKDLKPESEKVMRNDMGSGFEKIKWNDSDARLVYLWELLINEGLLSKEYSQLGNRRFALLASHFQREDGTPFVNKNLAKIHDRIINKNKSKKPREPEKIEKVINETKLKKLD